MVQRRYFWDVDEGFYDPFKIDTGLGNTFISVIEAFKENLMAVVTVGSVPSILARNAVLNQKFSQILTASRIRSLAYPGYKKEAHLTAEQEKAAAERAREQFSEMLKDKLLCERLTGEAVEFLDSILNVSDFATVNDDLLRQSLVMIWGAFEVIATDLAVALLNTTPDLVDRLDSLKRFKGAINIEILKSYEFNISKNIGDVFFAHQRLDSIYIVQETYAAMLQNSYIDELLKEKLLWSLAQKRHLIVHRRGVADKKFIKVTSENIKEGNKIIVKPSEINEYIYKVRDVGIELAKAVISASANSNI